MIDLDDEIVTYDEKGLQHFPAPEGGTLCGIEIPPGGLKPRPATWAGVWCTGCLRSVFTTAPSGVTS